jgi:ABC-type Na+ efflux pump permease subunit
MMAAARTVFRKELIDTLRDRRTLFMAVLSSVLMAPLLLLALSALVAEMETRAERREIVVAGIEHAPTLRNYLERQTYTVKPAPGDYEAQLTASRLGDPVLVIGPGFEAELARGETPELEVVSSSANMRARSGAGILAGLLRGFAAEHGALHLATRGVSPGILDVVHIQERDLANRQVRTARLTAMLPFVVLMAVAYGALIAALVMAVAIRCKTYKEAQTNNTLVILAVSLLPLVTILSQEGEQPWHLWVPVLAQSTLMNRVLKGETLNAIDVLIPLGVCAIVAAAGIVFVAWSLRRVTLR